jgi:mono/diheme cytochrome c family protein
MKHPFPSLQRWHRFAVPLVIALAVNGGLIATARADDAKPAATSPAPAKKTLTGAELYSIHCNRCHPERYPTERTAAQWKTIMLHMQVRANIPGNQARLILKYLQENSGR